MVRRWPIALALLAVLLPSAAQAQAWPARQPIKVIVPLSAGSAIDSVARVVVDQLSRQLGQTILIENRVGAGGTLAVAAAAKAEADGYTLLIHSTTHAVTATTYANPGYDARRDFTGVTALVSVPNVLAVPPKKYKTLKDLVNAGLASPGSLNYATVGPGSASHLNAERFLAATGLKAQTVPFKGGPEALTDIMTDRVQFYFVPLPPARGLMKGGKIDVLAVSGSQRASALPDVPTTVEAGFPNSDYNFWIGMFAPAAIPKDILARLNAETVKALAHPDVKAKLDNMGADPLPMTPAQFDDFVKKEIEINAALVKAAGVKIN